MCRLVRGRDMNKNILSFLPAECFKAKSLHEHAGPCPLCGGATNDGFIVWPDRPRGGAFLCRKCGASGDGIAFLMQLDGMSYREACEALALKPKRGTASAFSHFRRTSTKAGQPAHGIKIPPVPSKPEPAVLPCTEWMASAAAFLAECQRNIETSPEALLAIIGRFLTPHTAQRIGIGWNPADRYALRKSWGLPDLAGPDGKPRTKMLLPRGLVIATRRRAGVVALTVRCPNDRPESRPKYWQVKESANVPFVAGRAGLPIVLVESALDAALVWQESFNTVSSVALMGNMKDLDADTHAFIQSAPILLAAPDNDEGGRAAWQRWNTTYPHAILSPAIGQKDLGEMHAAALRLGPEPTLGEWCAAALAMAHKTAVASRRNAGSHHSNPSPTNSKKEAA